MTELPLWDHQKRAVNFALQPDIDCIGLFMDIGVGKSRTAIEILRHLCAREGRLLRVLILAPKIVLTNWKREIGKYSRIMERDIVILHGAQGRRVRDFIEAAGPAGVLDRNRIIITN